MNLSAKTKKQLEEALDQVVSQCPSGKQPPVLSDLYIMVSGKTGELSVYDDDDRELCRQVVSEWEGLDEAELSERVQTVLQDFLAAKREQLEAINLLRPFSFVLIDDDHEPVAELFLVDDDTVLIPRELMAGLQDDLDCFLKQLMED